MRNLFIGSVLCLLSMVFIKEVTGLYYLKYVDNKTCSHTMVENISYKVQNWLHHAYLGDIVTKRCISTESIKYFDCDSLQVLISKKLFKGSKND